MQLLPSRSRKAGLQILKYDRIRVKWRWIPELLCPHPSAHLAEVSRVLTHLLTDDLVVETQIAGGGSADLSSSI